MPWAPEYATVDEIRELIRIDDDADDAVIEAALSGASRAIDHACDPRPGHWRRAGSSRRRISTPVPTTAGTWSGCSLPAPAAQPQHTPGRIWHD